MEQELVTVPMHLSSLPVLAGFVFNQSLVFYVVSCRLPFFLFGHCIVLLYLPLLLDIVLSYSIYHFFRTLYCLVLVTASFGHCIVLFYLPLLLDIVLSCSIYRFFWTLYCLFYLPLLLDIVLSCSIYRFFWTLYCLVLLTAYFGHCIVLFYLPLLLDIVLSCDIRVY